MVSISIFTKFEEIIFLILSVKKTIVWTRHCSFNKSVLLLAKHDAQVQPNKIKIYISETIRTRAFGWRLSILFYRVTWPTPYMNSCFVHMLLNRYWILSNLFEIMPVFVVFCYNMNKTLYLQRKVGKSLPHIMANIEFHVAFDKQMWLCLVKLRAGDAIIAYWPCTTS